MENENCHDSNDIVLSQCKARYEVNFSAKHFCLMRKACRNRRNTVQATRPLFAIPDGETWDEIRKLLACETESAVSKLLSDISELELEAEKRNKMVQDLRDHGRNVVERKAREEAGKVQQRMKVRFASILSNALIKKKHHKKTAIKDACIQCVKLLSVLVAIQLDEKPAVKANKIFDFCKEKFDKYYENTSSASNNAEKHNKVEDKIMELSKDTMGKIENMLNSSHKKKQDKVIESMLISSLMDEKSSSKNTLSSSTWPEVSPRDTLITPVECRVIWEYFQAQILPETQAFTTGQEAARKGQMDFVDVGAALAKAAL